MDKSKYTCDYCNKICLSRAGKASHQRHIHPEFTKVKATDLNVNDIEAENMRENMEVENTSKNTEPENTEVEDLLLEPESMAIENEAEDLFSEVNHIEAEDTEAKDLFSEVKNIEAENTEAQDLFWRTENAEANLSEDQISDVSMIFIDFFLTIPNQAIC
jgi:uncharacterized cysteine cluster protein YcgN (CxxCxxCC family)